MDSFFRKNALIGLAEIVCRLPLIFTVGYLAKSVGAENFGNWSLILSFQVFVVGLAGLGLSSSLSRFAPSGPAGEAAAYLRYAIVLCLGPLVAAGLFALLLQAPIGRILGIKAELHWLLPTIVLMAVGSVADGFLDAFFKARMAVGRQVAFIAARTLVEVVAVVLVFVVTVPSLDDASWRLAGYVATVVLGKLAIYPWLLSGLATGYSLPAPDRRREFLRYGLPMVPSMLAVWLAGQSDRLVLSHFVAKADLGVYVFGASLAVYMVFLGYAVYPLLLPAASKLHDAGESAAVQALFQGSQQLFMLLWAGAMTCLALWSATIVAWTGGDAYAGSARVFLIVSFAVGIDQLMGIYQWVFHLVKRTDLILWLNLAYAGIMIISLALAGFLAGPAVVPWAVLAATVIFNLLRYRIALRYLFLPMSGVLVVQASALAIFTALLAFYAANWNDLVKLAISGAIAVSFAGYTLTRRVAPSSNPLSQHE